jgi:tetratricopeptide (TPR) repeat protein
MNTQSKLSVVVLISSLVLMPLLMACGANKYELQRREKALRDLGVEYLRNGDTTKALQTLLEAEEIYPEDHILQWYLGKAYFSKGENKLAVKHLNNAVDLKPDFGPAINDLGVVYLSMNNYDAAIAEFQKVIGAVLYATPHYPLSNLGYAYYLKKQYEMSASFYLRALEFEPNYPVALRGLGRTYVEMGKGAEAVAALTAAVEIRPDFSEAHYDLGRAYLLLGNYKKAKAAFEKVVVLSPESSFAREARKVLNQLRYVK